MGAWNGQCGVSWPIRGGVHPQESGPREEAHTGSGLRTFGPGIQIPRHPERALERDEERGSQAPEVPGSCLLIL